MLSVNCEKKPTGWILLDAIIILILVTSIILQIIYIEKIWISTIPLTLFGLCLLTSNSLRNKLAISRLSYWISLNIFMPKTRYNHTIWGTFIIIVGFLTAISSKKEFETELTSRFIHDIGFWRPLLLVVIFFVIVGLYSAQKTSKNQD